MASAKPEPKLMPGTSSGASYFAFARKGNVALGIKPFGVVDGERFDVGGTTYFMARLRSAPAGGLFSEEDKAKKVVKLQKAPENLWDAWPQVVWQKKSPERASTTIGIFLRGEFGKDEKKLSTLLGNLENGAMTNKMADYLVGLAGSENLIVSKRDLQQWLEAQYKPIVDSIVASIAKAKAIAEEMETQIGSFNMHAAILKKVYGATQEAQEGDTAEDLDPAPGEADEEHTED